MSGGRSKYWCFTYNNYSTEDERRITDAIGESCTYGVFGRETGEGGTPHLQGYIELSERKRFGVVKRLLGERVHLERRRGKAKQAAEYCKKDGDIHEYGTISVSEQGRRSDLEEIRTLIDDGVPEREIATTYFSQWVQYRKGFSAYRSLVGSSTTRTDLKVVVFYGAPGTGKTRFVWEQFPDLFSVDDAELRWFDGYRGQETVLIDDYRGGANDSFILKLLDIYPMQVPIKGGFVNWRPKRIFITSNIAPPWTHGMINEALRRRISGTLHFIGTYSTEQVNQFLTNKNIL